ncbi:STAS domain-containing protein [Phytohabitans sp. LJ34]|uniref:STAS domain-containing protein n=1 Tax=Phytohabitans sp. LJ34 TaxID=3452217 RepID=UPI003F89C7C9
MTLSIAHLYPHGSESVVLALRGTLDHHTAPHLRMAIIAEAERMPRPRSILVDLTDIEQVDPAGVGSLVAGNRSCAVAGIGLVVRGTSPLIRALLQLQTSRGPAPATASQRTSQWCTPRRPPRRLRPTGGTAAPPQAPARTRPGRGR